MSDSLDSTQFEKIVEETLAPSGTTARVSPEVQRALEEVARKHPREALSIEPIVVALVESVLRERIAQLKNNAQTRHKIAMRVAQTLMDDPRCQARLSQLWKQLRDSVR